MRLWHQSMIPYLDRQRLLGAHRECCALRGAGWGRAHATVNYVFENKPEKLVAYHKLIMREMRSRGYHPDEIWENPAYRGKTLGVQEEWVDSAEVETLLNKTIVGEIHTLYQEHNLEYLSDCVNNLKQKGVEFPYEK